MSRAVARRSTKPVIPKTLHLTPIAAMKVGSIFEWEGVQTKIAKIRHGEPSAGSMVIVDPDGNERGMGGADKVGIVSLED